MNSVTLVGRVGKEIDIKHFESGSVVAKFSLAVNRRKKDDQPDWFDLECWGKTAEVVEKYVSKGKQIAVKGSLKFDRWNDRNTGQERSRAVIQVDKLELLGSKNDANVAPNPESADVDYEE